MLLSFIFYDYSWFTIDLIKFDAIALKHRQSIQPYGALSKYSPREIFTLPPLFNDCYCCQNSVMCLWLSLGLVEKKEERKKRGWTILTGHRYLLTRVDDGGGGGGDTNSHGTPSTATRQTLASACPSFRWPLGERTGQISEHRTRMTNGLVWLCQLC